MHVCACVYVCVCMRVCVCVCELFQPVPYNWTRAASLVWSSTVQTEKQELSLVEIHYWLLDPAGFEEMRSVCGADRLQVDKVCMCVCVFLFSCARVNVRVRVHVCLGCVCAYVCVCARG